MNEQITCVHHSILSRCEMIQLVAGHSLGLLHQLQGSSYSSCSQDVHRPHFEPMPVRKLLQQSKLPKVGLCWSTWKVMVLPQWKESPVGATSSHHHRQTAAALLPCRKPPPSSPPPSLIVTIWYTNEHQREPEGDVELLHQHRVHLVVVAHLFEVFSLPQAGNE